MAVGQLLLLFEKLLLPGFIGSSFRLRLFDRPLHFHDLYLFLIRFGTVPADGHLERNGFRAQGLRLPRHTGQVFFAERPLLIEGYHADMDFLKLRCLFGPFISQRLFLLPQFIGPVIDFGLRVFRFTKRPGNAAVLGLYFLNLTFEVAALFFQGSAVDRGEAVLFLRLLPGHLHGIEPEMAFLQRITDFSLAVSQCISFISLLFDPGAQLFRIFFQLLSTLAELFDLSSPPEQVVLIPERTAGNGSARSK